MVSGEPQERVARCQCKALAVRCDAGLNLSIAPKPVRE